MLLINCNVPVAYGCITNSSPRYVENSTEFDIVYHVRPNNTLIYVSYFTITHKFIFLCRNLREKGKRWSG